MFDAFFYLYVCKYSWKIVLTSFMTVKSRQSDMSFGRVNNKLIRGHDMNMIYNATFHVFDFNCI